MADYKEETVTGNKWRRCRMIYIDNSFGTTPRMIYMEQDVVHLGDGKYVFNEVAPTQPVNGNPSLTTVFDPNATLPIYDPETLEPTGETTTHAAVYALLFSAYINAAKERDLAQAE